MVRTVPTGCGGETVEVAAERCPNGHPKPWPKTAGCPTGSHRYWWCTVCGATLIDGDCPCPTPGPRFSAEA